MPIPKIPKMPQKPAKNKKKIFPDPEFHQTKKEYFVKVRTALLNLRKSLYKGRDKEIIMSFIGFINPGERPDPTRLPFECRTDNKSRYEGKSECLFAMVNGMIQAYWQFCVSEDKNSADVDAEIEQIDKVTKNGLGAYKIDGTKKDGYSLVEK